MSRGEDPDIPARLVNFSTGTGYPRLGVLREDGFIVDIAEIAVGGRLKCEGGKLPATIDAFLASGRETRSAVAECASRISELEPSEPGVYDNTTVIHHPPVLRPGKILAAGRNYVQYLDESQEKWKQRGFREVKVPEVPIGFAKLVSTLIGHRQAIRLPIGVDDVDVEAEVVVVIGSTCRDVSEHEAWSRVAGLTVGNDLTARSLLSTERRAGGSPLVSKNLPTFGPMGPALVGMGCITDRNDLRVWAAINGEEIMAASTADMIHSIPRLVSWFSALGLEPGDMIMTGTPARNEGRSGRYLKDGDVVECGVEGVGVLTNPVTSASDRRHELIIG